MNLSPDIGKKIKLYDLFCFAFGIFSCLTVLVDSLLVYSLPLVQLTSFVRVSLIGFSLLLCILLLCIINRLSARLSALKWIVLLILFLVIFINSIVSNVQNYLIIYIFCLVISDNDFEKAIKALGVGTSIGIFIVLVSLFLGIIPNLYEFRTELGVVVQTRVTLGFNMAVFLPGYYLNLGFIYIYLNRRKFSLVRCVIIIIPAIIINHFTGGRASFVTLLVTSLTAFFVTNYFKNIKNLKKIASMLFYLNVGLFTLFFMVSVSIASNYNSSEFIQSLNELSSGRFLFYSLYWERYDATLFGQELLRVGTVRSRITGEPRMILDNAFLTILLEGGILLTAILSLSIFRLLKYLKNQLDIMSLIIWLSIILVFPFANNGMFFWRNPLIFQFSIFFGIMGSKKIKEKFQAVT